MKSAQPEEFLICTIARLLGDVHHVAVGALSPLPGAAALLARARSQCALRVSLLGSERHNPFTDGGRELFDCAAQGRIDAFFLGGAQIDGSANVNLVGIGPYPRSRVRLSGSFGSAYLYFLVPKVILFVSEHSPRVLVRKVDFISAPGVSEPDVYRRGGPRALLTPLGLFEFLPAAGRFRLAAVHPGSSPAEVAARTGFDFELPERVPITPMPDAATLRLLRGPVAAAVRETYPRFAERLWGGVRANPSSKGSGAPRPPSAAQHQPAGAPSSTSPTMNR